jgi:hypothetical protein
MEKGILIREEEIKEILDEQNLTLDLGKAYDDYGFDNFERFTDEDGEIVYLYTGYAGEMTDRDKEKKEFDYVKGGFVKTIQDILFTIECEKNGEIK